jgi:hypothetical protein
MMKANKYPRRYNPRRRGPLLWVIVAFATFVLVQFVLTLFEELPKSVEGLKR